jgi:hypothetical protein
MFRDKPLGNLTDKNVEGAEAGTKVSETDMTNMIEILFQQGKYKILSHEEYELLSHSKPSVKKANSVLISFLLGITLAHQEKLVRNFHLNLHLLFP